MGHSTRLLLLLLPPTLFAACGDGVGEAGPAPSRARGALSTPVQLALPGLAEVAGDTEAMHYVEWNGAGYFFDYHGVAANPPSLYRTDGTLAGTFLLQEQDSARSHSNYEMTARLVPFNGRLYWMEPYALWSTDGTPAGTSLHLTFPTGQQATAVYPWKGALWFGQADTLWRWDGTAAPEPIAQVTVQLTDHDYLSAFQPLGEKLLFRCTSPATGTELCVTDGTAAGTELFDLRAGPDGDGTDLLAGTGDGHVLFTRTRTNTAVLWTTDGTLSGTQSIPGINPTVGTTTASALPVGVLGGRVYFACSSASTSIELCGSDGTEAGTFILDLLPGTDRLWPAGVTAHQGAVYFMARSSNPGLWRSDGTLAGTTQVLAAASPRHLVVSGGSLYLLTADEAFRSDGTSAGTVSLGAVSPDKVAGPLNGGVFFTSQDDEHDLEPWFLPSAGPAALIADLSARQRQGYPHAFVVTSSAEAFFKVALQNYQPTLWRTDGTPEGSAQYAGPYKYLGFLARLGTEVLYAVGQTDGTFTLYRADPEGPTQLATLPSLASSATEVGGFLLFGTGGDLWRTDGTAAGTVLLREDVSPTTLETSPLIGGRRVIVGTEPGNETLYLTDGTAAGTTPWINLQAELGHVGCQALVQLGPTRVLYIPNSGPSFREPWVTDGTPEGTQLLAELAPGTQTPLIQAPTPFGDRVIFRAVVDNEGSIWVTDGTPSGTLQVAANPSGFASFAAFGGHAFFGANADDGHGAEVFRTDGTVAGTARMSDLWPGLGNAAPTSFATVGGALYFSAKTPLTGFELFRMDTPDQTPWLVADVAPGGAASRPTGFTALGEKLLFSADAPGGDALFAVEVGPPDDTPPTVVCPTNFTVVGDATGAVVTFEAERAATASDDSPGPVALAYSPASGATFGLGQTEVTVTAQDLSGNEASCTFTVEVVVQSPDAGGGGSGGEDGGAPGAPDGGAPDGSGSESGCGCTQLPVASLWPLLPVLLVWRERRPFSVASTARR